MHHITTGHHRSPHRSAYRTRSFLCKPSVYACCMIHMLATKECNLFFHLFEAYGTTIICLSCLSCVIYGDPIQGNIACEAFYNISLALRHSKHECNKMLRKKKCWHLILWLMKCQSYQTHYCSTFTSATSSSNIFRKSSLAMLYCFASYARFVL